MCIWGMKRQPHTSYLCGQRGPKPSSNSDQEHYFGIVLKYCFYSVMNCTYKSLKNVHLKYRALDRSVANVLAKYLILAQFYSKNGPPKGAPKFGAILFYFVPLKSSSFPQKGSKTLFNFETGPKCRQQIGLKANIAVAELRKYSQIPPPFTNITRRKMISE